MFDRIRNLLRIKSAYDRARDLYEQPAQASDPRRWTDFFKTIFSITEVGEMLTALQGYKTYIVAALAGAAVAAHALGYVTDDQLKTLLEILGATAVATVGAKINRIGKTLVVILALSLFAPTLASAQTPLLDSGVRIARDYQVTVGGGQAPAAASTLVAGVQDETWLRVAQTAYISSMAADAWASCTAMRQKDVNGAPINEPSNALIPSSCNAMLAEKVGVAIAGLVASEKLWPDHKWEAVATLAGSALATLASVMTNVYEPPATGDYPAPKTVSGKRFVVAVTIGR